MRTLSDLIEFNDEHCDDELRYFGQELFHVADATRRASTTRPTAKPGHAAWRRRARTASTASWPPTGSTRSSAPAYGDSTRAGGRRATRPSPSRPARPTTAGPAACGCPPGFLAEPTLLGFAFDLESAIGGRPRPTFAGAPDLPPDAGICAIPIESRVGPAGATCRPMSSRSG